MEKAIAGSVITIGGIVGIKIYGASIFILFTVLYSFLSIIDILLGIYIGKLNDDVNSARFIEGVIKKSIGLIIIMVIAILAWHISYLTDVAKYGIVAIIPPALLTLGELMSIAENYKMLKGNKYENKVITLLLKILGLGNRITEKIIDTKIKTVLDDKQNQGAIQKETNLEKPEK